MFTFLGMGVEHKKINPIHFYFLNFKLFNKLLFFLNNLHLKQFSLLLFKCSLQHKADIMYSIKIILPILAVEYYSIVRS